MNNYKKLLPLVAALALVACGGNSDTVPDQSEGGTKIGTHPRFDLLTSDVPLNTDLLFADAADSDGTANTDGTDPVTTAIRSLDGFSTSAYFDIGFSASMDPSSLCTFTDAQAGECAEESMSPNVFLVPLNSEGDALDPENIDQENPVNLAKTTPFTAEVVSLDSGTDNTLRVIPQQPLLAKTKYLVVLSNGILDASGSPVTPSSSYAGVLNADSVTDDLAGAQKLLRSWDAIAGGVLRAAESDENVVLSYTFTTTDPATPLVAMGAPRAAVMKAQLDAGLDAGTAKTNAGNLEMGGLLSTPQFRELDVKAASGVDFMTLTDGQLSNAGKLYTGYIKLPYYLSAPASASDDYSFLQKSWQADTVLGSQLGEGVPPQDLDGAYNVTYRYPFAEQTGTESVPLQVTLPDESQTLAELGGASCADVRDGGGYPVVIYVHGITSDRTSVVALAHTLASKCVATVAIDLPMHGVPANSDFSPVLNVENSELLSFDDLYDTDAPHERHFNVVQDELGQPAAMNFSKPRKQLDDSGSWFINLASLTNTRDNLRQSVMDLMNLNASLDEISELDIAGNGTLNLNKVKVVGVSLGGIVGTVFSSVNQQAIAAETQAGFDSELNSLKGLVVSAGGSQLTQILNNSPTFAPKIQAGLAASGVMPDTSDYEKFLYVAQSTVASGDPVNFAQTLDSEELEELDMPIVVQQVVGGGDASDFGDTTTYQPDQVVPNSAPGAPLAGTTPLAGLLGAVQAGPGSIAATDNNVLVNITVGEHASLLTSGSTAGGLLATTELQTEVASFILAPAMTAVGAGQADLNQDGMPETPTAPYVEVPPGP